PRAHRRHRDRRQADRSSLGGQRAAALTKELAPAPLVCSAPAVLTLCAGRRVVRRSWQPRFVDCSSLRPWWGGHTRHAGASSVPFVIGTDVAPPVVAIAFCRVGGHRRAS